MFTGIIEEIGQISSMKKNSSSLEVTVRCDKVLEDTKVGDSIATNGVCLTVTSMTNSSYTADVMPETVSKTNVFTWSTGYKVNLERAVRVGTPLGGHMVSGHVHGTGKIKRKQRVEQATLVEIMAKNELLNNMVDKGSIAIDGISLTVVKVNKDSFVVSLIPHTGKDTTLLDKRIGETVNLECDQMLIGAKKTTESKITMSFLQDAGFID